MFENVLIPLDGSEAAEAAVAFTQLLPCRRVRLIHVLAEPTAPPSEPLDDAEQEAAWRTERVSVAQESLDEIGAALRQQDQTVEVLIEFGDPAERIVEAAKNADLIIMTSHGYGAGRRVIYGSVADRVVRSAPAPTLVVRGGERPVETPALSRIVVPLDGSPVAEHALPVATVLATALAVPLHLIRVVDVALVREVALVGTYAATKYGQSEAAMARQAQTYLSDQVEQLQGQQVVVTSEIRMGATAMELLAAIRPEDLVVMTTHGRSGLRRWLIGSIADKVVRNAPAPVLLTRPDIPAPTKHSEPAVALQ